MLAGCGGIDSLWDPYKETQPAAIGMVASPKKRVGRSGLQQYLHWHRLIRTLCRQANWRGAESGHVMVSARFYAKERTHWGRSAPAMKTTHLVQGCTPMVHSMYMDAFPALLHEQPHEGCHMGTRKYMPPPS